MTLVRVKSERLAEDIGCEVGAVFPAEPVDARWFEEDEMSWSVIVDFGDGESDEWFANPDDVEPVAPLILKGYND